MGENISKRFGDHVEDFPDEAVNFREIFESELFGIALKQVSYIFLVQLQVYKYINKITYIYAII